MAKTYKRLGAVNPATDTYQQLYQVPASTSTVISTVSVCNATNASRTYRLGIVGSATAASAIALSDHFVFDTTISANDSTMLTIGIAMNDEQKLICYGSSASVVFTAWGVEVS